MGWTYYRATNYRNGKIDRLAECRYEFGKQPNYATIVKDALVGTTYYAAMKCSETGEIWALIVRTSINNGEFGYKDMSEDMEPYYYDCPISILKLLSPTNNEMANQWRYKCRMRCQQKRQQMKKAKELYTANRISVTLPIGKFRGYDNGGRVLLEKHTDGRWVDWTKKIAFHKSHILDCTFTVLE